MSFEIKKYFQAYRSPTWMAPSETLPQEDDPGGVEIHPSGWVINSSANVEIDAEGLHVYDGGVYVEDDDGNVTIQDGIVTAEGIEAGSVDARHIRAGGLAGNNAVTNSGFEHGTSGWTFSSVGMAIDVRTSPAYFHHEGAAELLIPAGVYQFAAPTAGIRFNAGKRYTASFYMTTHGVAGTSSGGAGIVFEGLVGNAVANTLTKEDGTEVVNTVPQRLVVGTLPTVWTRYSVSWTQINTIDSTFLITNAYGGTSTCEVFFDAIQIEESAFATNYAPGPMDVASSTGEVLIDASGITINNGKIIVRNAGAQVIIDGSSRMFRIAASGTIAVTVGVWSGAGAQTTNQTSVQLPGLGTQTTIPAHLSFISSSVAINDHRVIGSLFTRYVVPIFGSSTAGAATNSPMIGSESYAIMRTYVDASNFAVINIVTENASLSTSKTYQGYYHILKEEAL